MKKVGWPLRHWMLPSSIPFAQRRLGRISKRDKMFGSIILGVSYLMDYIERVLEKLKDWAGKLIEILLGPDMQPEAEPIPIPVDDRMRRSR